MNETEAIDKAISVKDCIACSHLAMGTEPGTFVCNRNAGFQVDCPLFEKYSGPAS